MWQIVMKITERFFEMWKRDTTKTERHEIYDGNWKYHYINALYNCDDV